MNGNKSWFIVDGYRPPVEKGGADDYEGHECIMVLNCNDEEAPCVDQHSRQQNRPFNNCLLYTSRCV